MEAGIINAQTGCYAGPEVFDQNISLFDQFEKNGHAIFFFKVKGDAFFTSVEEHEVGALSVKVRPERAGIIPSVWPFDLGDIRPKVCQHGGAQRSCQNPG
nr:hypothetical protein [Acetobacter okinawensis]